MKRKTRQFNTTITTTQVFEQRTVHILSYVVLTAVALYMYGMLSTVSYALTKRNTEAKIRDVVAETASLEGKYLALSGSLTVATSSDLGLQVPKHISFAKVATESLALAKTVSSF